LKLKRFIDFFPVNDDSYISYKNIIKKIDFYQNNTKIEKTIKIITKNVRKILKKIN
jgi:alanine-alpha-ketoisovalerate/valine-pyruvate aminotransferase